MLLGLLAIWALLPQAPDDIRITPMTDDPMLIRVYLPQTGRVEPLTLSEYVAGVVASEMPASWHTEALKAQAVAARTYALQKMRAFGGQGCQRQAGADVCADSAHCQGYLTIAQQVDQWGAEATLYRTRVQAAAEETRDEYLQYDGKPITALYHAVSGGYTEAAQAVFSHGAPYLQSVRSTGEEENRRFETITHFAQNTLIQRLEAAFPGTALTRENLASALYVKSRTATGRAQTVQVGNQTVTGAAFRAALSLPSAWISLQTAQDPVTITSRGYGHGVGMSQAGAAAMAFQGQDYRTILAHYYQGATLARLQH